jgi:hypothetical protein
MIVRAPLITFALFLAGAHSLAGALVQAPTPEELASRLTGTWKLNRELSPTLSNPRPGEGRRGRGASFAMSAAGAPQRGGRGGGGGANEPGFERPMVTTEEAAAQAALAAIHQVPPELTIEATASEMKLVEARGESLFKIDGKTATVAVPGARIKVKSKWDRGKLRQEFSSALQALVRSWSVDAQGRLILTQQIQSPTFKTKEFQAFFDKQ